MASVWRLDVVSMSSDVEVADLPRLAPDEVPSGFDPLAHEGREDVVGLGVREGRQSLIERSLRQLAGVDSGVLVLIREGSPASVASRLRAAVEGRSADAAAGRRVDYGVGAQILLDLGVREMELLSNSPLPKIIGLEGYGLKIIGRRAIE